VSKPKRFSILDGPTIRPTTKLYAITAKEYKTLGEIVKHRSEILDLVHRDLEKISKATSRRGRKPTFTSENLFRAVLVMQREALDYRDVTSTAETDFPATRTTLPIRTTRPSPGRLRRRTRPAGGPSKRSVA